MGVTCSGCCSRDSRDTTFSREAKPVGHELSRSRDRRDEEIKLASSSSTSYAKVKAHIHDSFVELADPVMPNTGSPRTGPANSPPAEVQRERLLGFEPHKPSLPTVDEDVVTATPPHSPPQSPRIRVDTEAIWGDTHSGSEHVNGGLARAGTDDSSPDRLAASPDLTGSSPSPTKGGDARKKSKWRSSVARSFAHAMTGSSGHCSEEGKTKGGLLVAARKSLKRRRRSRQAPDGRVRIKTGNTNEPQSYIWLEAPLKSIASNKAVDLGSVDAQTKKAFVPLFFVIGGCPNYFCGMQVIAYFISSNGDGEVDFWWVKPTKGAGTETEHATLCRQTKGPHKNDPGRSKPFYKPLADMFKEGHVAEDGRRYAIEAPPGERCPRAFIEEDSSSGEREKLWLHLVWQEDWTSNPWSRSKYIKGKIVYQRRPEELEFYAREYCIKDGAFQFSMYEDAPFTTILPGETIKELYEGATEN